METKVVSLEVNSNLDNTTKSISSLKTQLREAQNEVNSLSDKFGATSKQAIEAAKRTAELKDRIGDAKALTEAFNPDAKFKALTASLSGVAGGFAAIQGGMGLIGVESADLERQLLKVQSAMALSQGLQSVGESIDSFKQLAAVLKNTSAAQVLYTSVTATATFVTNAATTGLKLFRLALVSTGIGAIVVGLGLLIANFDKVKKAVLNLVPGLAQIGEFFGNIINSVTDFIGVTSEAERAMEKMTKNAEKSLKQNDKYLKEHAQELTKYQKDKIAADNEYFEAVKTGLYNEEALRKQNALAKKKIDEEEKAEKNKLLQDNLDKIKSANEKEKSDRDRKAKEIQDEKNRKIAEDLKEAEDFFNKSKENSDKYNQQQDEIRQGQLEALATYSDATTNEENKAADDKVRIAQAEAEQKKAIQDAQLGLATGAVDFLKTIAGKNKAIQKAAIIAENAIGIGKMIIANNAANIGALATPQAIATSGASAAPVIAMNNITTGLGIATTIAATAKALQAVGGGGAGGGAMSNTKAPAGGAPQFNVVGNTGTSQLAQSMANQNAQPLQAYVVSGAVTSAQSLDRNIISNASIG
jgi:hypothetical protein